MNKIHAILEWIFITSVIGALIGAVIGWGIEEYARWLRQDPQTRQAQRIARQATRDFKRRQRLRSVRFWNF